jgi:hypothetical protein
MCIVFADLLQAIQIEMITHIQKGGSRGLSDVDGQLSIVVSATICRLACMLACKFFMCWILKRPLT